MGQDRGETGGPWHGVFNAGARGDADLAVQRRVLTVPNAVTLARLLAVVPLVMLVISEQFAASFIVFALVALTDWIDGYLARRLGQVSRLGQVLDPLVDRFLIVAVLVALLLTGLLPTSLVLLVLLRDAFVLLGVFVLYKGAPTIPVTRTGKSATAGLLLALTAALAGAWLDSRLLQDGAIVVMIVATVGYYVAGGQYALEVWRQRSSAVDGEGVAHGRPGKDDPRA